MTHDIFLIFIKILYIYSQVDAFKTLSEKWYMYMYIISSLKRIMVEMVEYS